MAENIGTAYVQIVPTAKGISGKIEQELGGVGKSAGQSFSTGFGSVLGGIGKVAVAAVGAAATAVGGIVSSAVSQYADFEQLAGGVETLFGDSAEYVINRAGAAFETAGLSANDYMETVTSFSASLLQSLGGDTDKAAKVADQAIVDMADNANKMGSSMESIQNAYQGFAKQNYTMLDNLKLGYGGTKEEMQRLLKDAEKISGQKFDLSSYADIIQAIHVMQENMGIAGTTSKEAATTISGSLAMVKGAWDNVLSSVGQGNMDKLNENINNLVYSAETFAGNIMPVVQTALSGVSELISALAPEIAAALPEMIAQVLPGLLDAGVQIIDALTQGLLQAIPQLMPAATDIIMQLIQLIIGLLPQLVEVGAQVIVELVNGISQAIPTILPMIAEIIPQIVQSLIDSAPLLIQAGVQLLQALAQGLLESLPVLVESIPQLVQSLVDTIVTNLPLLIDACVQVVDGIVGAMPQIIQALVTALPQIIDSIVQGIISALPALINGCVQMVTSLVAAFPQILTVLVAALPDILNSIVNGLIQALPVLISGCIQMIVALVTHMPEIIQALITAIPEIISAIVEAFGPIVDALGEVFKKAWEGIKTTFSAAGSWFGQKFSEAKDNASKQWNIFTSYMKTAYNNQTKVYATVGSFFQQKFKDAVDKIKSVWSGLTSFFSQVWDKIKATFTDVGSKFLDVGKQIVEGIKKGIESAWGNLKEWFSSLFGDLTAIAKKMLGISSPSKVFANEIGKQIPAGIAMGIEEGMDALDGSIVDMTANITGTATSEMASYQPASDSKSVYDLLSMYLPVIANKDVNIKLEGGMDRFFRAMQAEARRNYQLTGAAL